MRTTNRAINVAALGVALAIFLFGVAFTILTSCTPVARSTMTGTFAACANADLGKLITPGLTVAGDVASLIESNAPTLEADLTSLAATIGIDAVECAIAAVEAVLLAPAPVSVTPPNPPTPPSPPTALTGSGILIPPGLVRARAWLGDARAKAHTAKAGAK